ncbi:MAG: hypothetical protein K2Q01_08345, partial [Rickettsiales bacterium]|nr:hypothetical protein [Rickettsiales bacterium]
MRALFLLPLGLLLSACENPTPEDYANKTDPERQLVSSTEFMAITLENRDSLEHLKEVLQFEPPTSAKITCPPKEPLCASAKSLLLR